MPQVPSPVALRITRAALALPALAGLSGFFALVSCAGEDTSPTMMTTGPAMSGSGVPAPTDSGTGGTIPSGSAPMPPVTGTMGTAGAAGMGGAGGGMGGATGGEMPPPRGTDGPSYAATVAQMFQDKCTATCHEPGGLLGGPGGIDMVEMDLTTGAAYAELTTKKSIQADMWVVGTGTQDSYLWHKLADTHMDVGGSGVVMPLTGERLTQAEMDVVQAWIEGGATP